MPALLNLLAPRSSMALVPPLTDTFDLLQQWRSGDRDALDRLLQRDMEWIRRRVHLQLGQALRRAGDTEDFVQEAALAVLRDGPRFVLSSRRQFRALLAKITTNVLRGQNRRLHALKRGTVREEPLLSDSILDLDPHHQRVAPPDQGAAHAEEREWLRMGQLLLDPKDQAVTQLHWEGLADAEIGAQLGLTANTARMRRTRAIGRLTQIVRKLKDGRVGDLVEGHEDPQPE